MVTPSYARMDWTDATLMGWIGCASLIKARNP